MGSLSEKQFKSGSCFQTGSVSSPEDSSSPVATLRPGLFSSFSEAVIVDVGVFESDWM